MAPQPHGKHRRLLVEAAARPQLDELQVVVVERQHAEQPHPAAAHRRADRNGVDGQRLLAARHRHRHPRPQFVVDALRRDDARPHPVVRRVDDVLPFDDHRADANGARCRWGRYVSVVLLVPTLQQGGDLAEKEIVEVAHLREAVVREAAARRLRHACFSRLLHRGEHLVLVGVQDRPCVIPQPVVIAATGGCRHPLYQAHRRQHFDRTGYRAGTGLQ